MNVASYHTKLVGTTFEGRQEVIAKLKKNKLRFRWEFDNEYDEYAVAVDALFGKKWVQIGYIARDSNKEIKHAVDNGMKATIELSDVTGGGDKNYGVNVYVEVERPRNDSHKGDSRLVEDIFGNEIFYDDANHKYTSSSGKRYLSASRFASNYGNLVDMDIIVKAMSKKFDLSPSESNRLREMWSLKGQASMDYGHAIHESIELYGKYKDLSEKIGKDTHIHSNPVLGNAVTSFYDQFGEAAEYEALVVSHKLSWAGRIDRLEKENGEWIICDYKTGDLSSNLEKYWLQLSFYARIIQENGDKVSKLKVYHWTGEEWSVHEHEVVDLTPMIESVYKNLNIPIPTSLEREINDKKK